MTALLDTLLLDRAAWTMGLPQASPTLESCSPAPGLWPLLLLGRLLTFCFFSLTVSCGHLGALVCLFGVVRTLVSPFLLQVCPHPNLLSRFPSVHLPPCEESSSVHGRCLLTLHSLPVRQSWLLGTGTGGWDKGSR